MLIHIIKLPDDTELWSGTGTENAVMSVKCTESVNVGQELTPGAAFASMIEATVLTPGGGVTVNAGDEVTVYKADENGNRTQYGIFILEKPVRPTANTLKLTGYDRLLRLDKDLTDWVNSLTGWPYRLTEFAEMVCNVCGIGYMPKEVPNGDFPVYQFSKANMTGRQIMRWLGEICCRFCRATPDGRMEFAWYEPSGKVITPTGDGFYFAGSLSYDTYTVAPVDAVQMRLADGKNGALWPDKDAENPYVVTGNNVLLARVTEDLLPYLQVMEQELQKVTYAPMQVSIPATLEIRAGHTVTVLDKNGKELHSLVMTKTTSGQRDRLECTGSYRRDSADTVNNKTMNQIAQEKVDAQTQQDIFNKLTDNGKTQGFYVQDGKLYINAEFVQIVNLVAEVLRSTNGRSSLSIGGAEFEMKYDGRQTVHINNEHGNSAQIGLTTYSPGGMLESAAFFSARQFELGGPNVGDRLYIGVSADTGRPYMILPGAQEPMRDLSWKYSAELGCDVLCGSY